MQPSFLMPPPQFSGRWDEGMTTVGRPSSMYAALNARPVSSIVTSPRSPRKLLPLSEASKRPIPPTPLEHFWNEHTLRNNARNLTRMVEYQVALPPVSPSDPAKLEMCVLVTYFIILFCSAIYGISSSTVQRSIRSDAPWSCARYTVRTTQCPNDSP